MKKKFNIALLLLSGAALATTAQTWTVDKAHAKLGFTVTHMMVSDVEGWFKSFDAKFTSSKEDFSDAAVELTADVNSINTDNDRRDAHLKSADFFEAAKFPSIIFKSKSFQKIEGKKYKLTGELTMHGITKIVDLDVTFNGTATGQGGKKIAGFKVTGMLKRSDFGIAASTPKAMLSDEVQLLANAEFDATVKP
jgi:polyisoprenoid-binding protein YceI